MAFSNYPKWKYHATKNGVVVNDSKEEDALGDGWHDDPDEAKASVLAGGATGGGTPETTPKGEAVGGNLATDTRTKDELIAEAEAKGVSVDKRWSIATIAAAIDNHPKV